VMCGECAFLEAGMFGLCRVLFRRMMSGMIC
jgi:ribosomal protein S14